jgi:hypothetical protein
VHPLLLLLSQRPLNRTSHTFPPDANNASVSFNFLGTHCKIPAVLASRFLAPRANSCAVTKDRNCTLEQRVFSAVGLRTFCRPHCVLPCVCSRGSLQRLFQSTTLVCSRSRPKYVHLTHGHNAARTKRCLERDRTTDDPVFSLGLLYSKYFNMKLL